MGYIKIKVLLTGVNQMANHKSSEKRIRQTKVRRLTNRYASRTTRNSVRKLRSITSKEEARKEECNPPEQGQQPEIEIGISREQPELISGQSTYTESRADLFGFFVIRLYD